MLCHWKICAITTITSWRTVAETDGYKTVVRGATERGKGEIYTYSIRQAQGGVSRAREIADKGSTRVGRWNGQLGEVRLPADTKTMEG